MSFHVAACTVSMPCRAQREEEKRREQRRHQELLTLALQHHNRALLRRGLARWKSLVQLQHEAVEVTSPWLVKIECN